MGWVTGVKLLPYPKLLYPLRIEILAASRLDHKLGRMRRRKSVLEREGDYVAFFCTRNLQPLLTKNLSSNEIFQLRSFERESLRKNLTLASLYGCGAREKDFEKDKCNQIAAMVVSSHLPIFEYMRLKRFIEKLGKNSRLRRRESL